MVRYVGKRFLYMLLTLWVIITLTFFLMHLLPGDPFSDIEKLTPEIRQQLLSNYGLDKPLIFQYFVYLKELGTGNLGTSMKSTGQTVNDILSGALPISAQIGAQAAAVGIIFGLLLGIIASLKQNTFADYFTIIFAVIFMAVPSFVIATLLQYFVGLKLGWFPVARWDREYASVLPTLAIAFGQIAFFARMMRASMLDVIGADYMMTAKAKGIKPIAVVWRHTIRNAILPVITFIPTTVLGLITGSLVIEQIFAIPGMGKWLVESIYRNDYSITMGLTLVLAAFYIVSLFLVDVLYGFVDPRIRVAGGKE
ncbi:ABC transporter permease [Rubeoparvulum massiliense]|uniref:ABC transporter permease n=1 Tax=Rubeoparvulum massiliense TaxID=1631346 RepID=UPI00065DE24D|nr:ABC transporter permease [Rubeoparvulum massiliense]